MAKLLTRSGFASLCGVNPSSITKACAAALAPACAGKLIDADHPAALAYWAERNDAALPEPAEGVDPFYERAVAHCRETGRWSANSIKLGLSVGSDRAKTIFKMIEAAGLVPAPGAPPPPPPVVVTFNDAGKIRPAHIRGHAAARETLKRSAPVLPPDEYEIPANIEAFADMTLREVISRYGTDVRFLDWLKATKEIEMINERRIKNAAAQGKLITRDLVERGVIDPFNSAHLRLMSDGAKSLAASAVTKHMAGAELIEIERHMADVIGSFLRPVKNKVAQALRTAPETANVWDTP